MSTMEECYDLLIKTGRAFGFVNNVLAHDLGQEIKDAMCVLYLVFRAADTLEDDMSIPTDVKLTHLKSFNQHLQDPTWKFTNSKDEYAIVLEQFPTISKAVRELPPEHRDVVIKGAFQFSQGMAAFVGKEIATMRDLDEYSVSVNDKLCLALTNLFVVNGLESETLIEDKWLIKEFSCYIQKTNVIKDFLKDWNSGRLYWPRDIWSKYTKCPGDFIKAENNHQAVECLNEMITDNLQHLPAILQFLSRMKSVACRRFCTVHAIMGIASLELCFNNPEVFTKNVKITRTETVKLIHISKSPMKTLERFQFYTSKIMTKATQNNSQTMKTHEICDKILTDLKMLKSCTGGHEQRYLSPLFVTIAVFVITAYVFCLFFVS